MRLGSIRGGPHSLVTKNKDPELHKYGFCERAFYTKISVIAF